MIPSSTKFQILCGTGGVGKTTLSAATALMQASNGKKSIVITIDPAKRLADSLGIKNLNGLPQKIFSHKNGGECFALMLEPKSTFDRLIHKYSPSQAVAEKILDNRIYQNLSSMISGSQEYMAMEMIFEIWDSNEFDILIIDTPPLQNAIDFLLAPQKMVDLLQDSMLKLFLKPNLAQGAAQGILKMFDRIIGFEFIKDLSELVVSFQYLLNGFESRAAQIQSVFKSKNCEFILVTSPQVTRFEEVLNFQHALTSMSYSLSQIFVNRDFSGKLPTAAQSKKDLAALQKYFDETSATFLAQNYSDHLPLITASQNFKSLIEKKLPNIKLQTIPFQSHEVHDLSMLLQVAEMIVP